MDEYLFKGFFPSTYDVELQKTINKLIKIINDLTEKLEHAQRKIALLDKKITDVKKMAINQR